MIRKLIPFLWLALALLCSCESDVLTNPTTTVSGQHKLLLNPSFLDGEQYHTYIFRARVSDVPASELNIMWDFDEGEGIRYDWGKGTEHTFTILGVHTVRCNAYDYFTDSLIAADSIRVDIRPPASKFELSKHVIDTVLGMSSNGSIPQQLRFVVTTSTPSSIVSVNWDFGDGSGEFTSTPTGINHTFPSIGTYVVRAEGHDTSGLFLGRDSCLVTIRMPTFSYTSIKFCRGIEVFLAVDSTNPILFDPLFRNPLSTKLDCKNDSVSSTMFTEPTFFVTLDSLAPPDHPRGFHRIQESIQGAFSPDLKTLKTLFAVVNDTGRININSGYSAALHFSFHLMDLELLAVTNREIVYRSRPGQSGFADNIQFAAKNYQNAPAGVFGDFEGLPEERLDGQPYALVIIRR